MTPDAALAELLAGNHRFVTGTPIHPHQDAGHRTALAAAQNPFAVIFGCSDSRLAAEIIFDRGLGDLFVVRTAGQAIGSEVLGSIEYAVTVLGTPLVAVLGHSSCGAVRAAWEAAHTGTVPSGHLRAVVNAALPAVRQARAQQVSDLDHIVDLHIAHTVATLEGQLTRGTCTIVGLSYHLAAGVVHTVTP